MKTQFAGLLSVVIGLNLATAASASSAHDDASQSAYADGWDDGDNGGTGFGPWTLNFNGEASQLNAIYNSDPHFIDGVDVGPLGANQLGAPAFGLTTSSQPSNTSATAEARRDFAEAMQIGQTFRIDIDGSALEGVAEIGNVFELLGADGVPRYSLSTSLGSNSDQWRLNGSNTSIPAGDDLSVSVTLVGTDNFSGSVNSIGGLVGTFSLNAPLGGTAGEPITGLRIATSGTGSSADGARELFFDNLELTRVDVVPEPATGLIALGFVSMAALRRVR